MAIQRQAASIQEKQPLGGAHRSKKEYKQEYFDIHSCIDLLDVKAIMKNPQEYIKLVDFGYLQFMELPGKDLGSLSYVEVNRTIQNFEKWLSEFNTDIQFEVTTLPTNTDAQRMHQRHWLSKVRQEKSQLSPNSKRYLQLEDREKLLQEQIQVEESIQKEIYNTEFILWLFAPTTSELDELVRKAKSYGNNDFVPQEITHLKKVQIITQYNNMNEKL